MFAVRGLQGCVDAAHPIGEGSLPGAFNPTVPHRWIHNCDAPMGCCTGPLQSTGGLRHPVLPRHGNSVGGGYWNAVRISRLRVAPHVVRRGIENPYSKQETACEARGSMMERPVPDNAGSRGWLEPTCVIGKAR